MKIFYFIILMVLFTSLSFGQITDSVGTATVYWQKIDLIRTSGKMCEVINDSSSSNYMLIANTVQDTVAGQTRYQVRLENYESFLFYTVQTYIYVKASLGTALYRVRTYPK